MNKKIVACLLSGALSLGLYGCNDSNKSVNNDTNVKEEYTLEEFKSFFKTYDTLYLNHYNSINELDYMDKIESQNALDKSIQVLQNAYNKIGEYQSGYDKESDDYKALDNLKSALFNLTDAKKYAIKYLDSNLYDDYKSYEDILSISMDYYNKNLNYKEKLGIADLENEEEEQSKESTKGEEQSDNSNKTNNSNTTKKYYCGTCGKEITKEEKESTGRCETCFKKRTESSSSINLEGDRNGDGELNHLDDYDDSYYNDSNYNDNSSNVNNNNNSSGSADNSEPTYQSFEDVFGGSSSNDDNNSEPIIIDGEGGTLIPNN